MSSPYPPTGGGGNNPAYPTIGALDPNTPSVVSLPSQPAQTPASFAGAATPSPTQYPPNAAAHGGPFTGHQPTTAYPPASHSPAPFNPGGFGSAPPAPAPPAANPFAAALAPAAPAPPLQQQKLPDPPATAPRPVQPEPHMAVVVRSTKPPLHTRVAKLASFAFLMYVLSLIPYVAIRIYDTLRPPGTQLPDWGAKG